MIISSSNFAQNSTSNSGIISGKVIDSKTKKPLDYVNIILLSKKNIIANILSDDDGLFQLNNLKKDSNLSLKLNLVGYNNLKIVGINLLQKDSIYLQLNMESNGDLNEVIIIEKRTPTESKNVEKFAIQTYSLRNINSITNIKGPNFKR